ncbi:DUF1634 domain-containing protein [Sorangium sp. So ce375]|uniref:DUF1634 domain-containing protein n=1 Tax=Sorangium sp. So ce375 TaxID=3133306 RepID=UPI003F5C73BB
MTNQADATQGRRRPTAGADTPRGHEVEVLISNLLRIGVATSLVVVVLGTVLSFVHHPDYLTSPKELERLTSPGAAFPRTLGEVIAGLRDLQGRAVTVVGLLMLVATPVLRVAVSILAFIHQRDRMFVLITTTVLVLLLLAFALGKVEG